MALASQRQTQYKEGQARAEITALLEIAKQEGGALAEVAEELSNPRRSMLATMGEGFKNAFRGFVDIIQAPSNIVAGIISPDLSVQEALKKNTSVSSVLFGKSPEGFQLQDIPRFAVDVLTDPLSYITFGTSKGILGISAATEIYAGAKAAGKLGIKEGDKLALSATGDEFLDKVVAQQRAGMRSEFLVNERIKIADEITKAGGKVDEADMVTRLAKIDKEANDALIEKTLNRRLDRADALATVSRMIERHPALIETFVDKGGIKAFGKSILSAQRIKATKNLIPGMALLDHAWEPIRKNVYPLFDTKWTSAGKASAITSTVIQDALDKRNSAIADVIERSKNVYEKAGVSSQEAELINAAITARKEPADPKLGALYRELMYGGETEKMTKLGQTARYSKGQEKRNLQMMRKAGVAVNEIENHTHHILTSGNAKRGVRSGMSTETDAAKMRSINGFLTEDGKELIGRTEKTADGLRFVVGEGDEAKVFTIRPTTKAGEEAKIVEQANQAARNIGLESEQLTKEIEGLKTAVQEVFDDKLYKSVAKKFLRAGADKNTIKAFMKAAKEYLGELDVDTLVKDRIKSSYKSGILKATPVGDMSDETFDLLVYNLDAGTKSLPDHLKDVNKQLVEALKAGRGKKKGEGIGTNISDGELKTIADKLKDEAIEVKKDIIAKSFKNNNIPTFLKTLQNGFTSNPNGARRLMDSIVGRQQKLADLAFELEDIQKAAEIDSKALPNTRPHDTFYIDEDGKVLKRFTVSAKEAREVMGVDFEENQLLLTIMSSMEAIRVSVANNFMKDLTKLSGKPRSMAPEHWVPIDSTKYQKELGNLSNFLKNTEGEDLVFHPADAKMVDNFLGSIATDENIENIWKNFDRLNNVFKASVTSIWPAFHGRNAISNVFLHFLDIGVHSLNPANHALVANIMVREKRYSNLVTKADLGDLDAQNELLKMQNETVFSDKYNYNWTWGELRRNIRDHVVAFNPNITGLVDWSRTPKEMAEQISRNLKQETTSGKIKKFGRHMNPLSQDFSLYGVGRGIGSAVEDHARLMDFIVNLRKTGDVGLSSVRTKQFLFDYANLTRFEKEFMRRVIPFYTFMRKNTELQVRTLFKTPGRISGEIRAVQSIGDMLGQEQLSDEDLAKLPPWMRDRALIPLSKRGSILEVITGLETPIESFFTITKPNELLASVSPYVRVPVELASGVSFFHAKAISDLTNARYFDSAPGWVKAFIGYHEVTGERNGKPFTYGVSLRPERMHLLLNLPPTSRVLSTLGNTSEEDVSTGAKTAELLFGIKVHAVDLELEAERRERELKRSLETLLSEAKVGYTFTRYVPDEE
jgi:hypothetical protein